MSKRCSCCHEEKTLDCFSKNKHASDGFAFQCKTCHANYYQLNKEKISQKQKQWIENNFEHYQEYRKYYDQKREKGIEGKMRAMLRNSRKRAKEKGLEHTLKMKDIEALFITHCPITGNEIVWEPGVEDMLNYNPFGPSLDRTDPNQGYTSSNVRIISHQGNTWKNNMTLENARKVVHYLELMEKSKKVDEK
jgi:hypothetical protein